MTYVGLVTDRAITDNYMYSLAHEVVCRSFCNAPMIIFVLFGVHIISFCILSL